MHSSRCVLWCASAGALAVMIGAGVCARAEDVQPARPALNVVRGADKRPQAIEATNLPKAVLSKLAAQADSDEAFARLLALYVADDDAAGNRPAMAGAYSVDGTTLRFTPRFSLRPGVDYRAVLHPGGGGKSAKSVEIEFAVAASDAPPTKVTTVYPSADTLPENQLRFYVHFSGPMGRGEAYEHIQLLDLLGNPVDLPFLELGEELWDPRCQRLTLIIDPGRIKRGVKPREDQGPVLLAGGTFTLVLDPKWRDASGRPLAGEFRKRFKVGPPVESAIDPAEWKWTQPAPATKNPLVLTFPRPLDQAQLGHALVVRDADDVMVPGRLVIGEHERRWEFHPEQPWKAGRYQLSVDAALEDLAGNRIGRAFEIDNPGPVPNGAQVERVRLPFRVE